MFATRDVSALRMAVDENNLAVCKEIAHKCGKDIITAADSNKDTALHWAVYNSITERLSDILAEFLSLRIDCNVLDKAGQTPLMWAAFHGHTACAVALLLAGANTAIRDKLGQTAQDYARRNHRVDIVARLEDHERLLEAQRLIKPAAREQLNAALIEEGHLLQQDADTRTNETLLELDAEQQSGLCTEPAGQKDDDAKTGQMMSESPQALLSLEQTQQRQHSVPVMNLSLADRDLELVF
eukprot:m.151615 g.151615  ORF g.151615 m.151615 type:complete len:240 (-) comp52830_c0_seq6:68-787(-)